jgi:N6-adenosine-specific RNA methylase IME4
LSAGDHALVKYSAALRMLDEAVSVDEVLKVRNVSLAMALYAKQARETKYIDRATDLRMRAERRLGAMIITQKETVGLATGGEHGSRKRKDGSRKGPSNARLTLAEIRIDKKLSSRAQKLAALSQADFEARTAAAKKEAVKSVESPRAERAAEKKERRAEREAELGKRLMALPDEKFGVIPADPEWRFEVWSEKGMLAVADNHYATSELEEIKARNVPSIAADDCVLFLWATVPMLREALDVMAAWGFTYKSHFAWVKDRAGTGYWARNWHELLLIGAKGKIPAPAPGEQFDSVIEAAVREHSRKPEVAYEMVEKMFSSLPKIELNAGGPARAGALGGH